MKGVPKKKGGKRKGAGRKPSGVAKEAVTIYTDVSRFGGREGARMAIYEFLDGKVTDTGKRSFIPLDLKDLTSAAKKEVKPIKIRDLTKPTNVLKPQEQPKSIYEVNYDNAAIFKQIEAIKAERCPPERAGTKLGRDSWEMDQQKRIQELQNKLK